MIRKIKKSFNKKFKTFSELGYQTKVGEAPGTLRYIGEKSTGFQRVDIIQYNENQCYESGAIKDSWIPHIQKISQPCTTWINIDGLTPIELIEKVGKHYQLHALMLEDILNTHHRPKFDSFEKAALLISKMLRYDDENTCIISEQISCVITDSTLITFQEIEGDVFEPVHQRLRQSVGKIRQKKANYLLFCLLDAIVDNYFLILDKIGEELEALELQVINDPQEKTLQRIYHFKREITIVKKAVIPLRENISAILRGSGNLIDSTTELYFKDLYDNIIHVAEVLEMQRDMANNLQELYFSHLSNKMNNVMKTLTIISTIFIPLTFVVGVYGMNFDIMPELHWKNGYYLVWALMGVLSMVMLIVFRFSRWL